MSVPADAVNTRTARKAAIKRATQRAQRAMSSLDQDARQALTGVYRRARDEIRATLLSLGDDETLRVEVLGQMLGQIEQSLGVLAQDRDDLLAEGLERAAQLGVQPLELGVGASLTQVADAAVRFVSSFVAEDGLQLSDRLWRIDRGAREAVTGAVQQAVIQGKSASDAAQDFLARGEPVPHDLATKMDQARAGRVARMAGAALMSGEGNPYDNALRIFRTEINRAHGEAFIAGAEEDESIVGLRFLLSPAHPEPDICDMHARVNRYGLGPGVYPDRARCPWPAHPNTLSYVNYVFDDEISAEDRAGKEGRLEWLGSQAPGVQRAVLGGLKKRAALQGGVLRENEIATPWRVLKRRYERRGIDIDSLAASPLAPGDPERDT